MFDFHSLIPELVALSQVIMIDLVLAGDNAIVVGLAAAGLPRHQRGKVILIGIIAATVLRIMFALITSVLLSFGGALVLGGGLLLLWVCWKFWRELAQMRRERLQEAAHRQTLSRKEQLELAEPLEALPGAAPGKTMRQAIVQIVIADVSMSLDNVLAVAGAAQHHQWVLIVGLTLSVGLMGIAASAIAHMLKRYPWVAYLGLVVILWVAVSMIYHGSTKMIEQAGIFDPPVSSATAEAN